MVEAITGVRQQETVPDEVVRSADQIELVDMSPQALRRRLAHGNVYAAEQVDAALANYFREGNLAALRELSLLWVADRVEEGLDRYRADHQITEPWPTRERVVVALTGGPEGRTLLRRGAQIASRAGGELLAVYVTPPDGLVDARLEGLADLRQLTIELGGTFHTVKGEDIAAALLDFARGVSARQIVIGASRRRRWQELLSTGVGQRVVEGSGDIDVHLVTHELTPHGARAAAVRTRPRPAPLGARLGPGRGRHGCPGRHTPRHPRVARPAAGGAPLPPASPSLTALVGGLWPALAAAVLGSLAINWFFTDPVNTLTINDPQNLVALLVFVVVAAAVSSVVHVSERRAAAASSARREADALAASAESLLGERDQLPALLRQAVDFFGVDAAAVVRPRRRPLAVGRGGGDRRVRAGLGRRPPRSAPRSTTRACWC